MEPVKVGVIGCGVIGRHHCQATSEADGVELVAVADLIPDRVDAMVEKYGIPQRFIEGDDLIDQAEVEAVILALPAIGRIGLGLHALNGGKHLLTEKPIARSVTEVKQLLAAQGDLVAACCSSRFRSTAAAKAAAEFIATKPFGELRTVRCKAIIGAGAARKDPPPDWRLKRELNGGGILVNWGCYDLDYLLGLLDWQLVPETVFAQTWRVGPPFDNDGYLAPNSDAETHFCALIRCAGGTMITYERAEMAAGATENKWELCGTEGTLHLSMVPGKTLELTFDRAIPGQGLETETIWSAEEDPHKMRVGPIEDLAKAIREGTRPMTDLKRAMVLQQITDGIYASAEQGCSVAIG